MKRFLSAILVICLVFSLFPAQSAAGVDTETAVENVEDSTVALVDGNESQEEESLPNPDSSAEADAPQNGEQQETGEAEEEIPEDFEMSPIVKELVKNGPANEGNWYLTDDFVSGRVIDAGDSGIAKPLLRSGNGGATVKSSNTGQNVTLYRGSQISYGSGGSTFKYTVDYSGGTGLICTCASPLKAAPSNWTWSNKTYKLDTSDAYYYVLKAAFATSPYGPAQLRQSFWSAASTAQNNTSYSYLHAIVGYLHENSTAHWSQQMRTNILGTGGLLEKITVYANSHHNELDSAQLYMIKLSTAYDANGNQMQDMMFVTYDYVYAYVAKTSSNPSITNGNSNYSLSGARYGFYTDSSCTPGTEAAIVTTGSNGVSSPAYLLAAKYWVKELTAPHGYNINTTVMGPKTLRGQAPAGQGANGMWAFNTTDTPQTSTACVIKTSSDPGITNGNSNYSLGNAVYGIYKSESCVESSKVGQVTTGTNGVSNPLTVAYGTYWAKEISAPTGYELNPTVLGPINVNGNGPYNGHWAFYATDNPNVFPAQLIKTSSNPETTENNSQFSLAGARYGIYNNASCADGTEIAVVTTGENGVSNAIMLGYGNYWAKELAAPQGFKLDQTPIGPIYVGGSGAVNGVYRFQAVDEPDVAKLTIVKRSSNPNITSNNACYSLANARYNLYADAELTNLVGTFTTRADGTSNVVRNLQLGTYYLVEVEAPKGFHLDPNPIEVTLDRPVVITKEVTDNPKTDPVGILLQKIDGFTGGTPDQESDFSLGGAEYTVKYYDVLLDSDPAKRGYTPERVWVFRTDSNGFIEFSEDYLDQYYSDELYYNQGIPSIPVGTITIQETYAPTGYMLDKEIYVRKIAPGNDPAESVYAQNVPTSKEYPSYIRIEIMKHMDEFDQQSDWVVFEEDAPIESWNTLANSDHIGPSARDYTPEGGATFRIYPSGMRWEDAPETKRALITTDVDGIAISDPLPTDYYTVEQVGGSPLAYMMFRPMELGTTSSDSEDGKTWVAVINNPPTNDPPIVKTVDKTEITQGGETLHYKITIDNNSENRWENVYITDILPADGDSRGSQFSGNLKVTHVSASVDIHAHVHFQRYTDVCITTESVPDYKLSKGESRDEYYDKYGFYWPAQPDPEGYCGYNPVSNEQNNIKAVGAYAAYIDPGESFILYIDVQVDYGSEGGKWVNDSCGDVKDEYGADWSMPSEPTTTVFPGRLELHKSVDKDLVERDGYFTYTITLKNVSTATLQNVRLYDVLPSKNNRLDSCTANSFAENLYIEPLPTNTENPRFDVYTFVESDEGEQDVGMVDEYLNNYQDISQDYDEVFHYFQPQTNYVHNQTEAYLDVSDEPLIAYTVEIPELKPGDGIVVTVDMNVDPHVAQGGDYYVNQAHAFVYEQQASVVNSEIVRTEVVDREITGLVWYDQNHNGIQDDDEPRADGVYVQLVKEDGTYVSSLRTGQGIDLKTGREFGADTDGYTTDEYPDTYPSFCFYGVPAGEYRLEIDSEDYELESLGYMLTTQNSGDDRYDSDAHENAPFTLTSIDGIHMPTLDEMREQNIRFYGSYFNDTGYYGGVDFKFTKVDAKDMDVVLSGAKFELSNGEQTYTATSDRDGEVSFENIPEGTYELKEVKAPAGYLVPGGSWTVEIRAAGFLYGNYSDDDGFIKITANGDVPAFSSTSLQQGVFVGRDPLLRLQNNQIIDIPFTGASTALILQIVSFTFAAGALATVAVSRKKKRKSNAD